jgi:hypothetical protein
VRLEERFFLVEMVGITTGPPIWGYLKEGNGLPGEVCSGEGSLEDDPCPLVGY